MNLGDIKNKKHINNQIIYFLEKSEWDLLFENNRYKCFEFSNKIISLLKEREYYLSNRHNDISLGLGIVGPKKISLPYSFYEFNEGEFQRIQIEKVSCVKCGWKGYIGNPKSIDIYVGIPENIDKIKIMNESNIFPIKPCPNCKEQSFKQAIWIGN